MVLIAALKHGTRTYTSYRHRFQVVDTPPKAFEGIRGFDFDDILYLFAPIMWLGWQMPFVVGASIGAPAFALLTLWKWRTGR